jgi:hypothetical protein
MPRSYSLAGTDSCEHTGHTRIGQPYKMPRFCKATSIRAITSPVDLSGACELVSALVKNREFPVHISNYALCWLLKESQSAESITVITHQDARPVYSLNWDPRLRQLPKPGYIQVEERSFILSVSRLDRFPEWDGFDNNAKRLQVSIGPHCVQSRARDRRIAFEPGAEKCQEITRGITPADRDSKSFNAAEVSGRPSALVSILHARRGGNHDEETDAPRAIWIEEYVRQHSLFALGAAECGADAPTRRTGLMHANGRWPASC